MNIEREITALKQRISDLENNVINLATRTGNRDSTAESGIAGNRSEISATGATVEGHSETLTEHAEEIELVSDAIDFILFGNDEDAFDIEE